MKKQKKSKRARRKSEGWDEGGRGKWSKERISEGKKLRKGRQIKEENNGKKEKSE